MSNRVAGKRRRRNAGEADWTNQDSVPLRVTAMPWMREWSLDDVMTAPEGGITTSSPWDMNAWKQFFLPVYLSGRDRARGRPPETHMG